MYSQIGNLLRTARKTQQITLRELASKTGIDYSMISKYENGLIVPPKEKLSRLITALNIEEPIPSDIQVDISSLSFHRPSKLDHTVDDRLVVSNSGTGELAVSLSNGQCDLCGQFFPNSFQFLEYHYVVWLKDGGQPTLDNVVVLCPNCHKRVHIENDPELNSQLRGKAKNRLVMAKSNASK